VEAAAAVLDRLTAVGLINDTAYAADFASSRHQSRGLARSALARQLREKGITEPDVAAALSAIDPDTERKAAHGLVMKKLRAMRSLPDEVKARRLVAMLTRKGYSVGLSFEVVREALASDWDDRSAGI
jgi:regulatory protein